MAKIDTTKIENYDTMSAEEKLAALENFELDDIESLKKEVERYKASNSKANSEVAEYKKQLKEKMSEDEKKAAEAKEAQEKLVNEYNELKKKVCISENTSKFQELGYGKDEASICANAIAEGDLETFFATQKKHNETLRDSIKTELLKQTPKPESGAGEPKKVTKEEFQRMGVLELTEFKKENPDAYAELMKGE